MTAASGLIINPCIPEEWEGFTVTRKFRGATYKITVENPDHVESRVKEVTVDGQVIEGNKIETFADGKEHSVEVIMG